MSLQDQVNFEVSPWHLALPYITHLTHCVALVKFKFKNCKEQIKRILSAVYISFIYIYYILEIGVSEVIKIILKQNSCAVNFHTGQYYFPLSWEIMNADHFEIDLTIH